MLITHFQIRGVSKCGLFPLSLIIYLQNNPLFRVLAPCTSSHRIMINNSRACRGLNFFLHRRNLVSRDKLKARVQPTASSLEIQSGVIVRKLVVLAYGKLDQSDWVLRFARGFASIFELVIEF